MKVLNVDDNPMNLYLVESLLKSRNHEVTSVANGREALDRLEKEPYDIIISDILMPVMDGYHLCREIKKRGALRHIPFIFYTATYTEEKDRALALSLGAARFVVKPEEPEVFLSIVEEVLREGGEEGTKAPLLKTEDEAAYLAAHNERLMNKLDRKMRQLEEAKKKVQDVMLVRNREEIRRMQAEVARQLVEDKYRAIFENASEGILVADAETAGFIDANETLCAMFGYSHDELMQLSVRDIHPQESLPMVMSMFGRLGRGEIVKATNIPCVRRDGAAFYADIHASFVFVDGRRCHVGFFQDSTEQIMMENKLRASEQKYRSIFENAVEGIYQTTPEGRYISVNPSFAGMFGYSSPEEMMSDVTDIGRQLYVDPPERERLKGLLAGQGYVEGFEAKMRRKDGAVFWISLNARCVRDADGAIMYYEGTNTDITWRKDAEARLQKVAAEWSVTFDAITDGICLLDAEANVVRANKAAGGMLDRAFDEIVGRKCCELMHGANELPENCPLAKMRSSLKHEEADIFQEGKWFHVVVEPILDADGNLQGAVHIVSDITEHKIAEENICAAEEKYRTLFMSAREGIYQSTAEGRFLTVNPAMAEMYGYASPEEMIAGITSIARQFYYYPEDREKFLRIMETEGEVSNFEVMHRKKDGSAIWVMSSGRPVLDDAGRLVCIEGMLISISKRKQAEEALARKQAELEEAYNRLKQSQSQIVQQEKMATIGQLAAGIAHEINNPMSFISGNLGIMNTYIAQILDTLREQDELIGMIAPPETVAEIGEKRRKRKLDFILRDINSLVGQSVEGAERIKKIVYDLKVFSHVEDAAYQEEDINAGLESTINIIWNEIKYKAELVKELGPIPQAKCNLGQLNQVFMNLLMNAVQAIEKKGKITVKSWADKTDIYVSVTDDGTGIPEENLKRIFDPFFTTKEKGKGTGLGLSISYDIVRRHNGGIAVESRVGEGTAFTVRIPFAAE